MLRTFRIIVVAVPLLAVLGGCQSHQPVKAGGGGGASLDAARQALAEGEAGTSLAIAKGILSSQPGNISALTQAGDAETALGDRLAARSDYGRALLLAPHNVGARLGLGKLQIRDNLPAAEATFRGILVDAPHNPIVLNDLGYVLDLQEHHSAAQAMYRAAIAADPNSLPPRVNLALSLALSGQAALGEQMLRDIAAGAGTTPKVRLDFAAAQVIAGHDKDAAQTLANDLTPAETQLAIAGLAQLRPEAAK